MHAAPARSRALEPERIDFPGFAPVATATPAPRHRRFGDDAEHRPLFDRLRADYETLRKDASLLAELELSLMGNATRRPTPLIHARRLADYIGGGQILLKREDLAGDHPHLTVAVTGQALLARRLGRKVLVTGSADGRRGVAVATAAARLGLRAKIFMDAEQAERAASSATFIQLLGAELVCVKAVDYRGGDVREAALQHWAKHPDEAFLVMGLDAAPAPYPEMIQEFTTAIGREARRQALAAGKTLPTAIVTRGGLTSDALGLFPAFLGDTGVRLVCTEAEPELEFDARSGEVDLYKKFMPMSVSERKVAKGILDRLEYPSVAREHSRLKASGRVESIEVPRSKARQALIDLARLEGIIAPIETARALAWAIEHARTLSPRESVLVLMAEPADKDGWDIQKLLQQRGR